MIFGVLAQHHGKYVLAEASLGRLVIVAAVNEHVVLSTMPMQVTVEHDFALFHKLFHCFARMPNGRERLF